MLHTRSYLFGYGFGLGIAADAADAGRYDPTRFQPKFGSQREPESAALFRKGADWAKQYDTVGQLVGRLVQSYQDSQIEKIVEGWRWQRRRYGLATDAGEFKPEEHPRGNPTNAGQFTKGGGGGAAKKEAAEKPEPEKSEKTGKAEKSTESKPKAAGGEPEKAPPKAASSAKQTGGTPPPVTATKAAPKPIQELTPQDDLSRPESGDTTQPVKSLDELYDQAKKDEPKFIEDMEAIAKMTGGKVILTPEEHAEPGTRLKTKARAVEKIRDELGGDVTLLRDVMRGTIVNETAAECRQSAVDFIKTYGDKVLRVKDRFVKDLGGYRDILINYRTESGLVAEVQFNSKNLLDVKFGEGHQIYQERRKIVAAKTLTAAQLQRVRELDEKSTALYNGAYEKDGDGNWKLAA